MTRKGIKLRGPAKWLLGIAIVLFGFLLIRRYQVRPLPDRDIVFTDRNGRLNFINSDGSGLARRSPRSVSYVGATWSLDGNYLGMRRRTDYTGGWGTPVLISMGGRVFECRDFVGMGYVWGVGSTDVVVHVGAGDHGWEHIVLLDMATCEVIEILYSGEHITNVAVSPQGWLAIADHREGLLILTPEGEEVFREPDSCCIGGWSRDGEWLAFEVHHEGGTSIYVVRRDNSERRQMVAPGARPSWSPDGQWIVYAYGGVIFKADVETGEIVQLYEGGTYPSWRWVDEE